MSNHTSATDGPSDNVPNADHITEPKPTYTLNADGTRSGWAPTIPGKPFGYTADPAKTLARLRASRAVQAYNNFLLPVPEPSTDAFGPDDKKALLAEVLGMTLEDINGLPVQIEPPFRVTYGTNIVFKGHFYANVDLVILDVCPVTIGARVLCGPRVGIYTVTHSTNIDERMAGFERAYPIEIGDDCWIGGGAIINGPSKLGRGCVVAAGAVVRGDFPDYSLIGGVPAKFIKRLDPPTGHFDPSVY